MSMAAVLYPESITQGTPADGVVQWPARYRPGTGVRWYGRPRDSSSGLKDQPANERPREKLAAQGPKALADAELIAILLRTGLKGTNVVEVGRELLRRYGNSLQALARASVEDLCQIKGIGPDKAVTLVAAFTLAGKMAEELHAVEG